MKVVFDTNVLVAAARSHAGASFAVISAIPAAEFQPCLSVGLYTEWQHVLTRPENLPPGGTREDARRFLRYLEGQSHLQEIHFLWRPFLPDADDDMVLELAFAAGCRHIILRIAQYGDGARALARFNVRPLVAQKPPARVVFLHRGFWCSLACQTSKLVTEFCESQ